MSHFLTTVLVKKGADRTATIKKLMAPYQENNMGDCPKKYLKFRANGDWFDSEAAAKKALGKKFDPEDAYWDNPNKKWDWWVVGGRWSDIFPRNVCDVSKLPDDFKCFAVVTPDGEWIERGRMGWWACVSNEKPQGDWDTELRNVFKKHSKAVAVMVDCHI